jgi:hypothetical protein
MSLVSIAPELWTTGKCSHIVTFSFSIHYIVPSPTNQVIQIIITSNSKLPSDACLSARIATRRAVLVLIVDGVPTVTDHTSRWHSLLLHGFNCGVGRVVLGADLLVEAGVRGGLVEGGDFGDVLAVGLAGVYDSLVGVWC